MQLAGKIAVVTGAGRGIGRSIALTFAREGASVAVATRTPELALKVAEEIRSLGGKALPLPTDVSKEDSVKRMVEETLKTFGTVDILVANAGIQPRHFVHELSSSEFHEVLDVNLAGVFYCCKAVLPVLYEKRDGNIILINSCSGKTGTAFNAAYCASKFGGLGFMESLAAEAREYGVRVNAVCPGGVKTDMSYTVRSASGSSLDVSGFMEPEEIADVALFLASPQSRGILGEAIKVYGGVNYRLDPSRC